MTEKPHSMRRAIERAPLRVAAKQCVVMWRMSAVCVLLAAVLAGCGQTDRTITVTSDPPGALVVVNGVDQGRTPVTFDFVWYGDYRFVLSKDGYETLKDHRKVKAPPHEWVGADVIKEVFIPRKFHDDKTFHFELRPMQAVSEAELIERAQALRDQTLHKDN